MWFIICSTYNLHYLVKLLTLFLFKYYQVDDADYDKLSSAVTMRSQQMQKPKGVELKMTKDIENKLAELGINQKIPATGNLSRMDFIISNQ